MEEPQESSEEDDVGNSEDEDYCHDTGDEGDEDDEWPLHGFLNRTRIGNETMFNLEFNLAPSPGGRRTIGSLEALGSFFNIEASTQPRIRERREHAPLDRRKECCCSLVEFVTSLYSAAPFQEALPSKAARFSTTVILVSSPETRQT
ncbi:hypothetical protein MMC30_008433 [Trapelia coarctata]|nr:hypothetical protein [Trapelia coarctata]